MSGKKNERDRKEIDFSDKDDLDVKYTGGNNDEKSFIYDFADCILLICSLIGLGAWFVRVVEFADKGQLIFKSYYFLNWWQHLILLIILIELIYLFMAWDHDFKADNKMIVTFEHKFISLIIAELIIGLGTFIVNISLYLYKTPRIGYFIIYIFIIISSLLGWIYLNSLVWRKKDE